MPDLRVFLQIVGVRDPASASVPVLRFRPWLVIQMTEICDEKRVSLQLCYDVEKDALRVSFVVGADIDVEPITTGAHVLTIVSQRIDDLFPSDRVCTLAVCDPGGLLGTSGHEVLEVLVHELVERFVK